MPPGLSLADYSLTPPVALGTVPIQSINNRSVRVQTGAGDFIWKAYTCHDNPEEIRYEHRLLAWLHSPASDHPYGVIRDAATAAVARCDHGPVVAGKVILNGRSLHRA